LKPCLKGKFFRFSVICDSTKTRLLAIMTLATSINKELWADALKPPASSSPSSFLFWCFPP
ncbi:hypothetical protein KAT21_02670, partial [Candidatus Bathyarchaeota archaeon]|nr:hypothetical protein [Candidatus Bathyarchaeota archaeon]